VFNSRSVRVQWSGK